MPMTEQEIFRLTRELDEQVDLPTLTLYATDLGVNLANLAPSGSVRERAVKLVSDLVTRVPPRDGELLEMLRIGKNGRLRTVATELLTPGFFSPTGDPHDAIVLGKTAFVARDDLRTALKEFTKPSQYSTRVLVVRGAEPGGKSYSWEFLRHLAFASVGATAQRLRLRGTKYTPRQFVEQAFLLLRLDRRERSVLPPLTDQPQLAAQIDPLINAFSGEIFELEKPHWLVIDDLNELSVSPEIRATAYAMAQAVEQLRPPNLWLALLGYNDEIADPDLRNIAQDDARFPQPPLVAKHLEVLAGAGKASLTSQQAREIADLLFAKFPKLDKEAMIQLTVLVERMGDKLIKGLQP